MTTYKAEDIPAETDPDRVTKWITLFAHAPPNAGDLAVFREIAQRAGDPMANPDYSWSPGDAWAVYDAARWAAKPHSRRWHQMMVRLGAYFNS